MLGRAIRSVATHVLGLDLIDDGVLAREEEFKKGGRRTGCSRPPEGLLGSLRSRSDVKPYDLAEYAHDPKTFTCEDLGAGQTLLLEHVDLRLADPAWRQALLWAGRAPPPVQSRPRVGDRSLLLSRTAPA